MTSAPEGTRERALDGAPEGTGRAPRRSPKLRMVILVAIVAAYLIFRLVQGVLWLAGHL